MGRLHKIHSPSTVLPNSDRSMKTEVPTIKRWQMKKRQVNSAQRTYPMTNFNPSNLNSKKTAHLLAKSSHLTLDHHPSKEKSLTLNFVPKQHNKSTKLTFSKPKSSKRNESKSLVTLNPSLTTHHPAQKKVTPPTMIKNQKPRALKCRLL